MVQQKRTARIYLIVLLLAGLSNLFSRTGLPALDTLMTFANYMMYLGLLLFWVQSVIVRLVPSHARGCILGAGYLMLLYVLLRIFKYRCALSPLTQRYAVYGYWLPQTLAPTFFLMTCICIRRGRQHRPQPRERLLLMPAALLSLMVMSNDAHTLVYVPKTAIAQCSLQTGTYGLGPGIFLLYGWMCLTFLAGMILLFQETGRVSRRVVRLLSGEILLWFVLVMVNILFVDRYARFRLFNIPEVHTFGMLGAFEICIRNRLIPCNENYSGFFRRLQIPAVVTDRGFHILYRTQAAFPGPPEVLPGVLQAPVTVPPDQKLSGKAIQGGYAFWSEDERAIYRAQERLLEANELIGQENDLLRAETEQKEKDAWLQSQHRIYHEIAEKLYPCQKRITKMLEAAEPGTEGFGHQIALICVLNAYVKRKSNLLFLADEQDTLSIQELFLALQESAGYLTLSGLQTTAREPEPALLPAGQIIALYDTFQALAEQLLGHAPSLMVSWNTDALRMAAVTTLCPEVSHLPLPVTLRRSDGALYLSISPEGGEAV